MKKRREKTLLAFKRALRTSLILILALLAPLGLWANGTEINGIYYILDDDTETATVTYTGDTYATNTYSGDIVIPATVTSGGVEYAVTSIGTSAFRGCGDLTSITIGSNVTTINTYAFYGCIYMKTVTFGGNETTINMYAFQGCASLTTVTLPSSVTSLGRAAFYDCISLESIFLNENLTSIGMHAFYRCTSLTSIWIYDKVTSIGQYAFYGCTALKAVHIGTGVTSIGTYAFKGDISMTTLEFNATACTSCGTSAVSSAFQDLPVLKNVTFGDDVTIIPNYMFYLCTAIEELTIPETVTSIGAQAFQSCTALKELVVPESVTYIGEYAFGECSSLKSITLPSNPEAFTEPGLFQGCTSLETVSLPEGMTEIGQNYFFYCEALEDLVIPSTITSIGGWAFQNCFSLKNVDLPEGLLSLGTSAFASCRSFTKATFPSTLETMSSGIYSSNTSLEYLYSYIKDPSSFTNTNYVSNDTYSHVPLMVPKGTINLYKATPYWNKFQLIYEFLQVGDTLQVDGINYRITAVDEDTHEGEVEVYMNIKYDGSTLNVPSTITYGYYTFTVTSVTGHALTGNLNVTSLILPPTLREIQESAFFGVYNIKSLSFSGRTTPALETIGADAFGSCEDLLSLNLSKCTKLTSLGEGAFATSLLYTITLPSTISEMGKYCFEEATALVSFSIPASVTEVSDYLLYDCGNLTTVTIPEGVTSMGKNVFTYDSKLTKVICQAQTPPTITSSTFDSSNYSTATLKVPPGTASLYAAADYWQKFLTISDVIEVYDEFIVDGVAYKVKTIDNTNHVGTCKVISSESVIYAGDIEIPAQVTWMSTLFAVVAIEANAFYNCEDLTTISIAGSVLEIGNMAFRGCTSLTEVTIEDGLTTIDQDVFNGCTSLTSIALPETVTSIETSVFDGCTALTDVTLPSTVSYWGADYLFANCTSLKAVELPSNITSILENTFANCKSLQSATIPVSVTYIQEEAYTGTKNLASVTCYATTPPRASESESPFDDTHYTGTVLFVPEGTVDDYKSAKVWCNFQYIYDSVEEGLEFIVDGIAYKAVSLDSDAMTGIAMVISHDNVTYADAVTIPATVPFAGYLFTVTSIDDYAFSSSTALTEVTIPEPVTSIGNRAFYGCSALATVNFNAIECESAGTYSNSCFYGKSSIEKVNFGDNVTIIPAHLFYSGNTGITEVTIPYGVQSIGIYAFYSCTGMTTLNWNAKACQNVTTGLGTTSAFYSLNITEVNIGQIVDSIPSHFLRNNTKLETINIPSSVKRLGSYSFYGCTSLATVNMSNALTTIEAYTFKNCTSLESIIIPAGVTSIKNGVFSETTSLTSIECQAQTPPTVTSSTFDSTHYTEATLTVPSGTKRAYAAANYWSNWFTGQRLFEEGDVIVVDDIAYIIVSFDDETQTGTVNVTTDSSVSYEGSIDVPETFEFEDYTFIVAGVDERAFYGQSDLEEVILPSTITTISSYAFLNSDNLSDVYCVTESSPTITSTAFPLSVTLYMPTELADTYSSSSILATVTDEVAIENSTTPIVSYGKPQCNLDFSTLEGATAYAITGTEATRKTDIYDAVLEEYSGVTSRKETGLILVSDGETMSATVKITNGASSDSGSNLLHATLGEVIDEGCYVYGSIDGESAYWPVGEGGITVPRGYAFLYLPDGVAKKIRISGLSAATDDSSATTEGDSEAGVREVPIDSTDSGAWYTLAGIRVLSPRKGGLYLHNGQKVIY